MRQLLATLAVIIGLAGLSCARSPEEPVGQEIKDPKLLPTLESIQQEFVNNRCVTCHKTATSQNRHVALKDLRTIIEGRGEPHSHVRKIIKPGCPKQSFFLSIIREGKMPPRETVRDDDVAAIEKWIISLKPDAGPTCDDEPGGGGGEGEP